MNYDREKFRAVCGRFGLEFSETCEEGLDEFAGLLLEKNKVMNLTRILSPEDMAVKNLADSLLLLTAADFPDGTKMLDVGCGGGFPSVPLSIARPGWKVTAMDATAKKVAFVQEVAGKMKLNLKTVSGRAEDFGKQAAYREQYDLVTGRAVAAMRILSELCLPLVKVGGTFAAMKGASGREELAEAGEIITLLGGEVEKVLDYSLDENGEDRRTIILIKKVKKTPAGYPRAYAKMK